ncbi:MAG: protein translocase subunit SecDF [Candidatus Omnitrophota bacterium]|nr:MAG: protein translocase subunit SecDF [Candidatus Omnitrophota bacterium]
MNRMPLRGILILVVFILSFILIFPLGEKINLGLDLKGGMHLIYRVDTANLSSQERKGASERAVEIIRNRIDELGVKEPIIQPQGQDKILIQLPGVVDRERALEIIGKTALLEFKLVEWEPELIEKNKESLDSEHEWAELEERKILLRKKAVLTGKDLKDAQIGFDSLGLSYVLVRFNSQGSKTFAELTQNNVGHRLAIILDGKVKSAPVIKEPILNGEAQITGDFTPTEAKDLALVLRSGALPCPLVLEEERTVGPLLGSDSIRRGINAAILGGLLIGIFMIIYYLLGGVVTVLALVFNLILILAGLSLLGSTLTLPGIAGIILTLGMAVDANVLIYERIREELKLKRPLSMAVRLGYQKAFRTILDSNVTTLIAALFLFIFGTGPIKGFGVTLSLGILASMFCALVFTRAIFDFLISKKIMKKFLMFQIIREPKINFVKAIKFCLILSLGVILLGVYTFVQKKGKVFGIDFTGGQIQEYKFKQKIDLEELRKTLAEEKIEDVVLYSFSSTNTLAIKSSQDTYSKVQRILKKHYDGDFELLRVERVGPVVGRLLRKKAILAIIFAIVGILFYTAFRFQHFEFGLSAVIALFHDIFIALAFLLFFSYSIDILIITALLTIAGYSINDTIVVYDRIRELSLRLPKENYSVVINKAINQTLSRTIITSLTTIIVVLALFILGSSNLKGFSFTLLVGIISGTYSSIYIASPLVILFKKK